MRFRKFKKRINKDNKYLKNTLRRNLTGCGGGERVGAPRGKTTRWVVPHPARSLNLKLHLQLIACAILVY